MCTTKNTQFSMDGGGVHMCSKEKHVYKKNLTPPWRPKIITCVSCVYITGGRDFFCTQLFFSQKNGQKTICTFFPEGV